MLLPISKKREILWAEDDLDDQSIFQDLFSKEAKECGLKFFQHGKELLEFLEGLPDTILPDLIVLDINMPVLDGKATLNKLKQHIRFKNIPVIVCSTSESILDKEFCSNHKAGFITKPITLEGLKAMIQKLSSSCCN